MDAAIIVSVIAGVTTIGNALLTHFLNRKDKKTDEEKALCSGVQCLLRAEIIRSYEKYAEKGYCPLYSKQALTTAYKSYHALGGNDVATDLYEKVMDMPEGLTTHEAYSCSSCCKKEIEK